MSRDTWHGLLLSYWWALPLSGRGYVATLPTCGPLLIVPPALKRWGPPRRQGLCSHLAHLWATFDSAPRSEAVGRIPPNDGAKCPIRVVWQGFLETLVVQIFRNGECNSLQAPPLQSPPPQHTHFTLPVRGAMKLLSVSPWIMSFPATEFLRRDLCLAGTPKTMVDKVDELG